MTDFTYLELDDLDSAITDSVTLLREHPTPKVSGLDDLGYLRRIKAIRYKIFTLMHSAGSAA